MLRIKFCRSCRSYSARFRCPNCKTWSSCPDVADAWEEADGQIGVEELPVLECDECGLVAEVGELLVDGPHEVRFSVEYQTDVPR